MKFINRRLCKLTRLLGGSLLLHLTACSAPSTIEPNIPATSAAAADSALQVSTQQGVLQGSWADSRQSIRRFAGVRFAAAPVGANRWQPPQPPRAWATVRGATDFGAACYQDFSHDAFVWRRGSFARSEDCLFLNIWAPAEPSTQPRPVMLWLHGGSHTGGFGHAKIFDGTALATRDVVLVTMNYRLGVFGFLAHPALANHGGVDPVAVGNYGLWDKVAALTWLQQNISNFGGDPNNITIFGQSAGSASVCALMAAPVAKGLFHKAIGQSASCTGPARAADPTGTATANQLVSWLQQQTTGRMRQAPNEPLANWLRRLPSALLQEAAAHSGWLAGPKITVDGNLLPAHPSKIFRNGQQQALPLLVGSLANEGHQLFPLDGRLTEEALTTQLTQRYGTQAPNLLAAYQTELTKSPGLAAREILTDEFMAFGMRTWAALNAKSGAPSYLYFMAQPTPAFALYTPDNPKLDLAAGPRSAGAYHSGDLAYVFGNTQLVGLHWRQSDHQLSRQMADYWTNFAKYGDPNGEGLAHWPIYDSNHTTLVLDTPMQAVSGARRKKLDLLQQAYTLPANR